MSPLLNTSRIIHDAQAEALDRLYQAWDRQLDRAAHQAETRAEKLDDRKDARYVKGLRQQAEEALALNIASGYENTLLGMVAAAAGGSDIGSITLPAGIRVGSTALALPGSSELSGLIELIGNTEDTVDLSEDLQAARRSVIGALGLNAIPHPGDLAMLMAPNPAWADLMKELADQHAALESNAYAHPQLQMLANGLDQIALLKNQLNLLTAFEPNTLLDMLRDPTGAHGLDQTPPALITKDTMMPKTSQLTQAQLQNVMAQIFGSASA